MELVRFIFSSFWIWLGFTTLVAVVLKYLVDCIKAIRGTRKVSVTYSDNGLRTVEVENATAKDVGSVIRVANYGTGTVIDYK